MSMGTKPTTSPTIMTLALNMRLSVGITLWIFVLSDYLLAKSLPILDMDFDIENLNKSITCLPDTTFYTPVNVKNECVTAALDCVIKEFSGVGKQECEDPTGEIDDTLEFLEIILKQQLEDGHVLNGSNECACERWPKTPLDEFLKKIEHLLQYRQTLQSLIK